MRRAIVHFLWEGLAIVVAFCLMFFIAVWNGWIGYMPDMDTLSNPIDKFATQVYSANGKLIGTWNEDNGNRVAVDYNSISPNLVHALVATEDERFYKHHGIDYTGLVGAVKDAFLRALRHRLYRPGPCHHQARHPRPPRGWWRFHHHAAACQAALF